MKNWLLQKTPWILFQIPNSKYQMKKLDELLSAAKKSNRKLKIVIASAEDDYVLNAVSEFYKLGLMHPVMIGNKNEIQKIIRKEKIDLPENDIIHVESNVQSAKLAVEIIKNKQGDLLMKGLLPTKVFIKEILNKRTGINTSGYFSHVGVFESPYYHKLFGLSDAAINIEPDIETKKYIITNAVKAFHKLGVANPKVALLAPIEKINSKMQATIDAAKLIELHKSEKFAECEIEGPLALDIAISDEAAKHKGVESNIAGHVDILIVPEITSGNIFYKSLTYLGDATAAGILLGADAPVVVTSRADTSESKVYSLALAYSLCNRK